MGPSRPKYLLYGYMEPLGVSLFMSCSETSVYTDVAIFHCEKLGKGWKGWSSEIQASSVAGSDRGT